MSLNPDGEPQHQAKTKLIGSYFSKTEIDEARTVDNPVEFLRKKIIDERRVYGDANELSVVITGTGQVAIWLSKRGKEPDYVIKPKQLAQGSRQHILKKGTTMKQAEAAEKKALSGKIVFMLCVLISHLEDEKTQVQIGKINIDERGDEVKETLRIILRGFINAEPEIQKQILSDGASSDLMNQFIVDYIQRGRQFGLFAGETAGGKENNV